MRSIIIAAAGAAALFAASQAGAAATNNDQETRAVSFRGVNFNDTQSVNRFYARLTSTAREVCASQGVSATRAAAADRACVDTIVNQAVAGMQRPMLTARHDAKSDVRFATGF
jgi:UrcA family protein